jgi:hypothetical protein
MTPANCDRIWYKATLTPMAQGIFTESFYPEAKKRTGNQYVFFTQADVTPAARKVIVASKFSEAGVRMMTQELALKCLIPVAKATKAEMQKLNQISTQVKL